MATELDIGALNERISQQKLAEETQVVLRLNELRYLSPLFSSSLNGAKFENEFQRMLSRDLKCESVTYEILLDTYNTFGGTNESLERFVSQAEVVAGIMYCTEDDKNRQEALTTQTKNCALCWSGMRLFALSIAVLIEPLPLQVCMDVSHEDSSFDQTYKRLLSSLAYVCDQSDLPGGEL